MGHLPTKVNTSIDFEATASGGNYPTITLSDLENNYSLVGVNDRHGYLIATDKGAYKLADGESITEQATGGVDGAAAVSAGEISGSGETLWRRAIQSDYNPNLSGGAFTDTIREMRNDASVRATLKIAKTPILSARWFMEPASQEDLDLEVSDFIWKCLTVYQSQSWPSFLIETLLMLDYGVKVFEKVFDIRVVPDRQGNSQPRTIWKKLAPRATEEILEFKYDEEGGPESINIMTNEGDVDLEIWKALIFTYDKESGDLWGHSLLRSAYKHWFYKEALYKIDAIQKERHSIGIPIIKLPPMYDAHSKGPANLRRAEEIGRNLRTNEEAHVVLPPGWEVMFLKLEGNNVNAIESAEHHSNKMYENVLANFMLPGGGGSNGQGNEIQEHVYTRAVRFTAEIIRDMLNKYAIPQLCLYNWTEQELKNGFPELKVRRLGDERDWRVLSFAIRNLVGAGAVRPDDPLEAWLRDEMDMPIADPTTARQIVTEVGMEEGDPDAQETDDDATGGNPRSPDVGAGRQSRAGDMRQATTPSSNRAGADNSGTSGGG